MQRCLNMLLMVVLSVFLFVSFAESKSAPDFTLQDTNSQTVTLGSYKDKQAVLLLFWTTWCPYCRDEIKGLNDLRGDPANAGLEILAVDVGESSIKVYNFSQAHPMVYKVLLDQDKSVARSFGVAGVPTYILINQNGDIVFKENYFPQEYKSLISK